MSSKFYIDKVLYNDYDNILFEIVFYTFLHFKRLNY
jgi:hypothetical protein